MPVIAHLSDLHLGGDPRAQERLRAVVTAVRDLAVDAVLVTGDVTDHGAAEEYEQVAAELAAFDVPVLVLPGNHDERTAFRAALPGGPGARPDADPSSPVDAVHLVGGVLVALCDSTVPGRSGGRLDAVTLTWLDGVLAGHDGPALVCLHHPPTPTGVAIMDEIILADPDGLAAVVTAHPHVTGVLTGHAHLGLASTFAGRPLVVAPGVASTLRLPWRSASQPGWDDAVEGPAAPPGFAVHHVDDAGRLTSYLRAVPWSG